MSLCVIPWALDGLLSSKVTLINSYLSKQSPVSMRRRSRDGWDQTGLCFQKVWPSIVFFWCFCWNVSSNWDHCYVVYLPLPDYFFIDVYFTKSLFSLFHHCLTWKMGFLYLTPWTSFRLYLHGQLVGEEASEAPPPLMWASNLLSTTNLCATSCWWYLQLSAEDVSGPRLAGPRQR